MKTPAKMDLPKLTFVKKYKEEIVQMEVSGIVTDPEFRNIHRARPGVKKALLASMLADGFHNNKPVILGNFDGVTVLIEGYQRRDTALEARLSTISGITRFFANRNEALRAAKLEQLNRRNLNLYDVFHMLKNDLLERPAHRPKTVPFGTDVGDGSGDSTQGKLEFKEIVAATDISPRTLHRYLKLLRGDKHGHIERAQEGDISIGAAMKLISDELKGERQPRKLTEEKLLRNLFPDEPEYEAWIDHSGGLTRACRALRELAYREMGKFPPSTPFADSDGSSLPSENLPDSASISTVWVTSENPAPQILPSAEIPPLIAPNTPKPGLNASNSKKKLKVSKKTSTATGERGETNFGWPLIALADALQKVLLENIPPKEVAIGLSTPEQPVSAKAVQNKLQRVLSKHRDGPKIPLTEAAIKKLIADIRRQAERETES